MTGEEGNADGTDPVVGTGAGDDPAGVAESPGAVLAGSAPTLAGSAGRLPGPAASGLDGAGDAPGRVAARYCDNDPSCRIRVTSV